MTTKANARMDTESGLWYWTYFDRGATEIGVPCTQECHHSTRLNADLHLYDYSIEQAVEQGHLIPAQCEYPGCEVKTSTAYFNHDYRLIPFNAFLCTEHRNKENLRLVRPFVTPIKIEWS